MKVLFAPRALMVFVFLSMMCTARVKKVVLQPKKPRVSIITSVFKGDEFIDGFLKDIVRQTIFNQCELIIINADSPHNEEPKILEYAKKYPNIRYLRLEKDPGIYAVWNIGIEMSRAPYISNANLDDRLAPNCYEVHSKMLDENPDVDLVYCDLQVTNVPNQTFESHTANTQWRFPEFSAKAMKYCLPRANPMWRKTLHDKLGGFDETYKIAGDFEFWMRAIRFGSKFKHAPHFLGLYYHNPRGLSTSGELRFVEQKRVWDMYGDLFK